MQRDARTVRFESERKIFRAYFPEIPSLTSRIEICMSLTLCQHLSISLLPFLILSILNFVSYSASLKGGYLKEVASRSPFGCRTDLIGLLSAKTFLTPKNLENQEAGDRLITAKETLAQFECVTARRYRA